MCGIVGMVGNLNSSRQKMFRDMLLFDVVRGMDSTGILSIGIGAKPVYHIEKEVGLPDNLWNFAGQSDVFNGKGHITAIKQLLLGHNRASTASAVTRENAHPFEFPNLVGVHNGSIHNYREMEDYDHDVDSYSLYSTINKYGLKDAWKKFNGAAALVFWDKSDDTLNFIRNDERPLVYATSESGDTLFWASEAWMIQVAASRNKVDLAQTKETKKPLFKEFKKDHHYKYEYTPTSFKLLSKEEVEGKKYPVTVMGRVGGTTIPTVGGKFISRRDRKRTYTPGIGWKERSRSRKNKKKILDPFWAQGLDKANKDTRDEEFIILQYNFKNVGGPPKTKEEYFTCTFLNNKHMQPLEVLPISEEHLTMMMKHAGSNSVFKMTSRPRQINDGDGGIAKYRISSDHVRLLGNNVLAMKVKEAVKKTLTTTMEEPKSSGFPIYKKLQASEKEFKTSMESVGSQCTCCGNPLDVADAKSFLWYASACVACPSCQKDETLMRQIYSYV